MRNFALTEWGAFCLSKLQIDRWVLKRKLGIWLETDRLPLDMAAHRLLSEMLRYKGLCLSQVQVASSFDQVQFYTKIWILGDEETYLNALNQHQVIFKTKGLSQLLREPKYKKEVFQALSQVCFS